MTRDEWARVNNPWAVIEAAATDSNARDAAVVRIIDTLLQLQLVRRHDGVGFQPFSITGNVPMPSSGAPVDQCMLAAERYYPASQWHKSCAWLMDRLPPRQAAAMMLQAARVRPEKMSESVGGGDRWMVTAQKMVDRQDELLRALGMSEYAPRGFESVEALQKCARRARNTLRAWLKDEEMTQAA